MKKTYFYILLGLAVIALLYIVVTDGFSALVMFGLGYLTCLVMVKNYMRAKEFVVLLLGKIKGLFGKKNTEIPAMEPVEEIDDTIDPIEEEPKKAKKKKKKTKKA